MRLSTTPVHLLVIAMTVTLLAGCSGGNSQVAPLANSGTTTQLVARNPGNVRSYSVLPNGPTHYSHRVTKSWMKAVDAITRLTYMSDFVNNSVTVYGRNAVPIGQIGGLTNPQGLFVDSNRRLWVANTGAANIEVFERGATSPSTTLNDPGQVPVDVTVCPNGTTYVSNIFGTSTGGNISVYAAGSTSPTGTLVFPGENENFFVTCDAAGNVFTDLLDISSSAIVVEYAGGGGSGVQLPISPFYFPGGIKPDNAGNLLVDDQSGDTITEYTENGAPTGNSIFHNFTDIVDIAATRNSLVVGGADAVDLVGSSWTFPGGAPRQTYGGALSEPIGFAFDPGQKGI